MNIFSRGFHIMTAWLDTFESNLTNIHANAGITDDQVKADIMAQVQPLTDSVSANQAALAEVKTALTDLEAKLSSGDTAGAQAALATAQNTVASVPTPAAAPVVEPVGQ